jgi:serine/threonine protein kinase/tetratricopeptide (TPR) repeat protein
MRPSDLDPERWRRIDAVLEAALETPPADLPAFLDEACADDVELRTEVEALLAARAGAEARFQSPTDLLEEALSGATDAPIEGRSIGPFRLLREIGRGGMGVVYLAEDTRLGRHVALKALPPYLGVGPEARRRFEAEARAVSTLDHPNIATLYDIDESEDGQLYLVFAFYDGETLEARIARGPVPAPEALEVATQIAEGLGAAHRSGIVHRDVKPSNVLLTGDGAVKLLDFGVAKMAGENLTGEGVRLGTMAYMSPEHTGTEALDGRADLWSLGVVLYEMLAGARPFGGTDPPSILHSILHDEPAPPAPGSALADPLERIVRKLLCKDPDGRYQTTDDLLADLRAIRGGEPPSVALREPPPARRPRIRRIAVLPLANLTGEQDQGHLVLGVHDALIAELGNVRALGVISRTSVMQFQDTELPVPEIVRMLEVDAVVEGSVSRVGGDLAITVQLIAASPERHVWAETYRRGVEGVMDVAGEVARAIAAELEITLSPSEQDRLATVRSVKPEAYEAYTMGLLYLERRSPEGHLKAQRFLRRAIELDPGFAHAYAMLGEACGSAAFFGLVSPAEGMPTVRSLVEKALELDPNLAAAHTGRGAVLHFADWDWSGAEAALRRAIGLNPSYAYAHFVLADVLCVQRRYDEALAAAERNRELERFVPFSAFGPVIALRGMGEFDRAIERAKAVLEFFTDFWQGHWLLAESYIGRGVFDLAVEHSEAAAALSRRTPIALGGLGLAYALDGRREDAVRVLGELEQMAAAVYVGGTNFAMIHGGLGDHDQAFEWLERAYRDRDMALVHLGDDPFYDPLRADPRFADLLGRIGLEVAPGMSE